MNKTQTGHTCTKSPPTKNNTNTWTVVEDEFLEGKIKFS